MKKKFVSLSIFNLIILIENNSAFYQLLKEKFQHVCNLIVIHGSAVLALGMICPIVLADVLCFLSASAGIKYSTYILTILIANAPLRLLYSYIGVSFTESAGGLALTIGSIITIFIVTIKMWRSLRAHINT